MLLIPYSIVDSPFTKFIANTFQAPLPIQEELYLEMIIFNLGNMHDTINTALHTMLNCSNAGFGPKIGKSSSLVLTRPCIQFKKEIFVKSLSSNFQTRMHFICSFNYFRKKLYNDSQYSAVLRMLVQNYNSSPKFCVNSISVSNHSKHKLNLIPLDIREHKKEKNWL